MKFNTYYKALFSNRKKNNNKARKGAEITIRKRANLRIVKRERDQKTRYRALIKAPA